MNPDALDGLVIPGGWAPDKLRRYPAVTDLIRKMDEAEKSIGIICHGGLVAISAGIVKGHRTTGSRGIKDDLINAGVTWVDDPTFQDRNQFGGELLRIYPHFAGSWFQNSLKYKSGIVLHFNKTTIAVCQIFLNHIYFERLVTLVFPDVFWSQN